MPLRFLNRWHWRTFCRKNQTNLQRQINLVDDVALLKGTHSLKFRIDYRRLTPIMDPNAYNLYFYLAIFLQQRLDNLLSEMLLHSKGKYPVA